MSFNPYFDFLYYSRGTYDHALRKIHAIFTKFGRKEIVLKHSKRHPQKNSYPFVRKIIRNVLFNVLK